MRPLQRRRCTPGAFTVGRDVYFGRGRYDPHSGEGRRLLAHELTHVVQQAQGPATAARPSPSLDDAYRVLSSDHPQELEAERWADAVMDESKPRPEPGPTRGEPAISRFGPDAPTVPSSAVTDAVDIIVDALEGYTSRWDSENILHQFQGKDAGTVRSILQELKARGPSHNLSGDGMIDWLFGDMTAEDARTLRQLLFQLRVVDDLRRIVVTEIIDRLEGYTSDSDSTEIVGLLGSFRGADLDGLLRALEQRTGNDPAAMAAWLFGDIDRVNAERLRGHFFGNGGPHAVEFAASWTATRIADLLAGFTSVGDREAIIRYFESTPQPYRPLVQATLDRIAQQRWQQNAEAALMEDLWPDEYARLRTLAGLTLGEYRGQPGALFYLRSGWDWASTVVEWLACGIGGIITGLLSAVWDLVVLVWDLVVAIWHLIWSAVYAISGGAAGSSNWLAVKEFFRGLGRAFGHPVDSLDRMWEDVKLEFRTIEGPFRDCRRAEFFMRKVVNGFVTIILVFVGGYGAVKAAASGVRGAAGFVAAVRTVGAVRAVGQVITGAGRSLGRLVAVSGEVATALLRALRRPIQTISRLRAQVNVILLAAQDVGYWQYVRQQAGRVGGALVQNERDYWAGQRRFWRERGLAKQEQVEQLGQRAGALEAGLEDQQAPEQGQQAVQDVTDDATRLEGETQALHDDVAGGNAAPVDEGAPPATGEEPPTSPQQPQAAQGQSPRTEEPDRRPVHSRRPRRSRAHAGARRRTATRTIGCSGDWLRGGPIPSEGWKLHVSADLASGDQVADLVLPMLRRTGVNHKVVSTPANLAGMTGGQAGKFITIYPNSAAHARAIASALDELLSGRGLHGPVRLPASGRSETPGSSTRGTGASRVPPSWVRTDCRWGTCVANKAAPGSPHLGGAARATWPADPASGTPAWPRVWFRRGDSARLKGESHGRRPDPRARLSVCHSRASVGGATARGGTRVHRGGESLAGRGADLAAERRSIPAALSDALAEMLGWALGGTATLRTPLGPYRLTTFPRPSQPQDADAARRPMRTCAGTCAPSCSGAPGSSTSCRTGCGTCSDPPSSKSRNAVRRSPCLLTPPSLRGVNVCTYCLQPPIAAGGFSRLALSQLPRRTESLSVRLARGAVLPAGEGGVCERTIRTLACAADGRRPRHRQRHGRRPAPG